MEDAQRNQDAEIDVEELVVVKVAGLKVKKGNGEKLDHGVQFDEFEGLESGG